MKFLCKIGWHKRYPKLKHRIEKQEAGAEL